MLFNHLRVKNTENLVPIMQLSSEEDKCHMRYDEIRKTNQGKEVMDVEEHDLYKAEWNAFLEQEFYLDDESTRLFASPMAFDNWTEAGTDSETREFYELSSPAVHDSVRYSKSL